MRGGGVRSKCPRSQRGLPLLATGRKNVSSAGRNISMPSAYQHSRAHRARSRPVVFVTLAVVVAACAHSYEDPLALGPASGGDAGMVAAAGSVSGAVAGGG